MPEKVYLDESGNPIETGKVYLDDAGNPIAKPAAQAAPAAPAQQPEKRGLLGKIWDVVNTPVADFVLPEGVTTADIFKAAMFQKLGLGPYLPGVNDERTQAHAKLGDTPTKAAIKAFVAGSTGSTGEMGAGFTSPLGIGLAAAGPATKLPGAVGTLAKAATTGAGVGFGVKGAGDVLESVKEGTLTPENVERGLQGGAMVAGGLAAGGQAGQKLRAAGRRTLLLGRTPEQAYESALKPSTTLSEAKRARIIETGLKEEIPVTKDGLEKVGKLVDDLNSKIKDVIASDPKRPINPAKAVTTLRETRTRFGEQVTPEADLAAIDAAEGEFLGQFRTKPGAAVSNIPADRAQAIKRGTYRALGDKAYGELKGAQIEAQKALARGLKDELARQFPELKKLNARESKLLDLEPVMERAVNRIGNHQLMGIGTPVTAAGVQMITGSSKLAAVAGLMKAVLDDPGVKSRLAISLSKGGKVPPAHAQARLASYLGLLDSALQALPEPASGDTPSP